MRRRGAAIDWVFLMPIDGRSIRDTAHRGSAAEVGDWYLAMYRCRTRKLRGAAYDYERLENRSRRVNVILGWSPVRASTMLTLRQYRYT